MSTRADYFTTWSAYFLVLASVLAALCPSSATLGILLAAVTNTAVVSVAGPAVLTYGKIPGSCTRQHASNMWMHAVPALVALVIVARVPLGRASVASAVGSLVALDVAWALVPSRAGCIDRKVRSVYGVDSPWTWAAGMVLAQGLVLTLLRCPVNFV